MTPRERKYHRGRKEYSLTMKVITQVVHNARIIVDYHKEIFRSQQTKTE